MHKFCVERTRVVQEHIYIEGATDSRDAEAISDNVKNDRWTTDKETIEHVEVSVIDA